MNPDWDSHMPARPVLLNRLDQKLTLREQNCLPLFRLRTWHYFNNSSHLCLSWKNSLKCRKSTTTTTTTTFIKEAAYNDRPFKWSSSPHIQRADRNDKPGFSQTQSHIKTRQSWYKEKHLPYRLCPWYCSFVNFVSFSFLQSGIDVRPVATSIAKSEDFERPIN